MSEFLAPLNYDRAREALCRLSAYGGYDEQKAEEAMGVLRECYPLVFSKTEQELFPKGSVLLHLQGASVTDPLMNSRYVAAITMSTAAKNHVSAASGSLMDTASQ